jgi:hypothetical protein
MLVSADDQERRERAERLILDWNERHRRSRPGKTGIKVGSVLLGVYVAIRLGYAISNSTDTQQPVALLPIPSPPIPSPQFPDSSPAMNPRCEELYEDVENADALDRRTTTALNKWVDTGRFSRPTTALRLNLQKARRDLKHSYVPRMARQMVHNRVRLLTLDIKALDAAHAWDVGGYNAIARAANKIRRQLRYAMHFCI